MPPAQAAPSPPPPQSRQEFHVAIICALSFEADAVSQVFDIFWENEGHSYGQLQEDHNVYTVGAIGLHNVVLVHMPGIGPTVASAAANSLRQSFPNLRLALVVGVCGGVPRPAQTGDEQYLGDLIISTAVVQYDFGRQYPISFQRKDTLEDNLGRSSPKVRGFLAKLQTWRLRRQLQNRIVMLMKDMLHSRADITYPGWLEDHLYEADYIHKHQTKDGRFCCDDSHDPYHPVCATALASDCKSLGCSQDRLVRRSRAPDTVIFSSPVSSIHHPAIHFGRVGSGHTVMKSGEHRDRIALQDDIVGFEMEGAGVWDQLPTIIVKSICDYADSHKAKKWQSYAAMVAAAGAKAMLEEWDVTQSSTLDTRLTSSRQVSEQSMVGQWLVPFARDPNYVARHGIMEQIDVCLQIADGSPRAVLTGLGGVGKSQIAIEYAHVQRERNPALSVFWISSNNPARFRSSYEHVARYVQLPGHDDPKIDPLTLVYQWLLSEQSGPWLLILDNVDDLTFAISHQDTEIENKHGFSIAQFLPQRARSSILATSRNRQVAMALAGRSDGIVPITFMLEEEAHRLVRQRISLDRGSDADVALLSVVLDHFPLALIQATTYISQSPTMTIRNYLHLFNGGESDSVMLLSKEGGDIRRDPEVPNSVVRSWELSLSQLQAQHPSATEVFSLLAMFDRQEVPLHLLQGERNPIEFQDDVNILVGYALVVLVDAEGLALSIHRLVQLVCRAWLRCTATFAHQQERALEIIAREYQKADKLAACQLLEPHVEHISLDKCETTQAELHQASILNKRSTYLHQRGNITAAQEAAWSSVTIYTRHLGFNDLRTVTSQETLAITLGWSGRYAEAEQMFRTTAAAHARILGITHPTTFASTASLSDTLIRQGKCAEAEHIMRMQQKQYEEFSGLDHEGTLRCKHQRALILNAQGQHFDSQELHRAVLETRSRVLGPEHPETLDSKSELASQLSRQGSYNEAEELLRSVLAISVRDLGEEHPETLSRAHSLGDVLARQHKYQEAEKLQVHVLSVRRRILHEDHRSTMVSKTALALNFHLQGRYAEEEGLLRAVLASTKRYFGEDNFFVNVSRRTLAACLRSQGRGSEADELQMEMQMSEHAAQAMKAVK